MPFACHQTRRRVEADPAGAGQKCFGPSVQIGEVVRGADWTVERFDVGRELNQIAGDEARGEPEMAQDLHEQPAAVATRAAFELERFFRAEYAGLEPHDVLDIGLQPRIQRDQKIDRVDRRG